MKYLSLFCGFALIAITLACTNTGNKEIDSTDADETKTEKRKFPIAAENGKFYSLGEKNFLYGGVFVMHHGNARAYGDTEVGDALDLALHALHKFTHPLGEFSGLLKPVGGQQHHELLAPKPAQHVVGTDLHGK